MAKLRKKKITVFLITFLIMIVTTFIRYEDVTIDVPISFSLFMLSSLITIQRKYLTIKQTVIYYSVSVLIIELLAIIIDWSIPTIGMPNSIIQFLGVFAGAIILSKRTNIILKALLPILVYTFSIWYIGGGYNNFFQLLDGKTFTGATDKPLNKEWFTISREGDTLKSDFYLKKRLDKSKNKQNGEVRSNTVVYETWD